MAYQNNAVYWVGADGNVWFKSGNSVRNVGKPINLYNTGFDSSTISAQATPIQDPNPPKQSPPPGGGGGGYGGSYGSGSGGTSVSGGGGGGAAAAPLYEDKSNDIAVQMAGLGAVDQQQNSGLSAVDKALQNLFGTYDTEKTANETNYTGQSNTNRTNLQKNTQTAYVNAAQGRQGLFGTLASLGALNGDGLYLANRAVQNGANTDLSGASDNFGTNQTALDTAIGTFRQQDKTRRDQATSSAENARQNVRNQAAKDRLAFLTNLSNDYTAEGKKAQAKTYSDQAAALYPTLASTSIPDSNISYTGAAFTPGTLADYVAGANSTAVHSTPTSGNGGAPGLVASPVKKKQTATV